ncbi:histidine phosphatase family protein (plasmid) [Devosia sp. A8/3-2]|nr:histidine phosphatase family protein [Devosia sp. A8/3-2]
MKRLLLVRHGESEWNAARRLQGQADIGLSERGEAQAISLAPTIAQLAPDRVITSDLRRAKDRRFVGLSSSLKRTEPALKSMWVYGQAARSKRSPPKSQRLSCSARRHLRTRRGEDWESFATRTATATKAAFETANRLLVVCHGGVIRALLQTLPELPPDGSFLLGRLASPSLPPNRMKARCVWKFSTLLPAA